MAEEPKEQSGFQAFLIMLAALAALGALWWYSGGPSRADLRGIFLEPPAPVGTGGSYGPDPLSQPQAPYQYDQEYKPNPSY